MGGTKMDKMQQIEALFKDYYDKNKSLLTLDGVVEEKKNNVLFILKESNIGENENIGIRDFWFKNVYKAKLENKYYQPKGIALSRSEKGKQTQYYKCLSRIRGHFGEDYGIFYININKEGGKGKSDHKKMKQWLNDKEKQDFLITQISILAPEKIVIFSSNVVGNKIDYILEKAKIKQKSILKIGFHPSRYSKIKLGEILDGLK